MTDPEQGNKQRLIHVKQACEKISRYINGVNRQQFLNDPKVQDATIYQLIVIGEAVIHISPEILDKYPYPWYKVKAFRNYAAHEYFNIETWTVWEIVDRHVKELLNVVDAILENEFN